MKIRAAVLEEFGARSHHRGRPRRARAGEVLVRLEACGVCHTDLYTASGADPSGYAPTVLGHEGPGSSSASARACRASRRGPRRDAVSPQCRECDPLPRPRTNLCLAIREQQNHGYLPDGTTRLSRDGEPIRHFMGTSTFAEYTVMPEIALAKVSPEAPADRAACSPAGCRPGSGPRSTPPRWRRVDLRRVRCRHGRARGRRRLPAEGAERIICVDPSEARSHSPRPGRDRHMDRRQHVSGWLRRPVGSAPITPSRRPGGRGHAPGRRGGADGLGPVHGRRRRRARRDARGRPAIPDHRPARLRLLVRGRQGPRSGPGAGGDVPRRPDRMDPFISYRISLEAVNEGFARMEHQDGIRSVIRVQLTRGTGLTARGGRVNLPAPETGWAGPTRRAGPNPWRGVMSDRSLG